MEEIIIDGVDVSGCDMKCENSDCALYYAELSNDKNELIYGFNCEDNPNCHYKQFKQKEKEIEKLKNCDKTLIYIKARSNFEKLKKIKEIVSEPCILGENCSTCKHSGCMQNEILQIINEVEDV